MTVGLLDTSVLIDWDVPGVTSALPRDATVSAITIAELSAGPLLARDPLERARRQARLQLMESLFEPLPFDAAAALSYGLVVAAVTAKGRSHRPRIADLFIAATAHANQLDLYTRNPDDVAGLNALITVIGL